MKQSKEAEAFRRRLRKILNPERQLVEQLRRLDNHALHGVDLKYASAYKRQYRLRINAVKRAGTRRWKEAVFRYYCSGDIRCACCGERELDFLTLDHIAGNGREHRAELKKKGIGHGVAFYRWLSLQGYPPGLQVLCYNCNMAKGRHGNVCPHQREREQITPKIDRFDSQPRQERLS